MLGVKFVFLISGLSLVHSMSPTQEENLKLLKECMDEFGIKDMQELSKLSQTQSPRILCINNCVFVKAKLCIKGNLNTEKLIAQVKEQVELTEARMTILRNCIEEHDRNSTGVCDCDKTNAFQFCTLKIVDN